MHLIERAQSRVKKKSCMQGWWKPWGCLLRVPHTSVLRVGPYIASWHQRYPRSKLPPVARVQCRSNLFDPEPNGASEIWFGVEQIVFRLELNE